jgi:hypothetical protein
MGKIKHPFAPADNTQLTQAATMNLTVRNNKTFVTLSAAMGQNSTLNIANEGEIDAGATVIMRAASDGTARSLTPGTGCTGTAVSGTISKTNVIEFEWTGATWLLKSARLID